MAKTLPRYIAFLFLLRKDNRGNPRLFRYTYGFKTAEVGRVFLKEKEANGKHLYGVLSDTRTWDALGEFGDPEIENNWLSTHTTTDKYAGYIALIEGKIHGTVQR